MKRYRSLTLKLNTVILAVVPAIFIIIILINYGVSRRLLLKDAATDARAVVQLTVSEIADALSDVEEPTRYAAGLFSQYLTNTKQIKDVMYLLSGRQPQIRSSFLVTFDSTMRQDGSGAGYLGYAGGDYEEGSLDAGKPRMMKWAAQMRQKPKAHWTEPYRHGNDPQLFSSFLMPATVSINNSMHTQGMIAVEIDLKWLAGVIESKKQYDSDYVFILSGEGMPVVLPVKKMDTLGDIFQIAKRLNNPEIVRLADKMLAGQRGFVEMNGIIKNRKAVVYYAPESDSGWSVGVVFPKNELFRALYSTTLILFLTGLAGLLLIVSTVSVITRRLTRPLKDLSSASRRIGEGRFDVEMPPVSGNDEVSVLKDSLQNMQHALQQYVRELVAREKEKERVESELLVAHNIQMGYLRRDFVEFSSGHPFTIAAMLKPARHVGGDFYDYFLTPAGQLVFAVGDVAGKGVPAALYMAVALSLTRSGNYQNDPLSKIMESINRHLVRRNDTAVFTTCFLGILNPETGEMVFANAGHNHPYLMRGNALFEVPGTKGIALGVVADHHYRTGRLKLLPSDTLVLFTDGVTEAENHKKDLFGKERLEESLRKVLSKSPEQINREVYTALRKFSENTEQSDDMTILTLSYTGKSTIPDNVRQD